MDNSTQAKIDRLSDELAANHARLQQDRGSLSLGQLDGHGLARLREIVLETIDAGDPADKQPWALYEHDDSNGPEWTEADANEQRLRFADQIERGIAREAK